MANAQNIHVVDADFINNYLGPWRENEFPLIRCDTYSPSARELIEFSNCAVNPPGHA